MAKRKNITPGSHVAGSMEAGVEVGEAGWGTREERKGVPGRKGEIERRIRRGARFSTKPIIRCVTSRARESFESSSFFTPRRRRGPALLRTEPEERFRASGLWRLIHRAILRASWFPPPLSFNLARCCGSRRYKHENANYSVSLIFRGACGYILCVARGGSILFVAVSRMRLMAVKVRALFSEYFAT